MIDVCYSYFVINIMNRHKSKIKQISNRKKVEHESSASSRATLLWLTDNEEDEDTFADSEALNDMKQFEVFKISLNKSFTKTT